MKALICPGPQVRLEKNQYFSVLFVRPNGGPTRSPQRPNAKPPVPVSEVEVLARDGQFCVQRSIGNQYQRETLVAHLSDFSEDFYQRFEKKLLLYFFSPMMQKKGEKIDQKPKSRLSCLDSGEVFHRFFMQHQSEIGEKN